MFCFGLMWQYFIEAVIAPFLIKTAVARYCFAE